MTELEGKVALITGASRGIGAAVARRLAAAGVKLGLASRSGDDLGIEHAVARQCDVRDARQLDALVRVVEEHGGLDIVVANAGVGAYGPFLDLSPEHLDEMIDVNVKGTLYAVRAALPQLWCAAAKATSSPLRPKPVAVGCRTRPCTAPRSLAQVGFTRALDHELRETGVRCANICPAASRPISRWSRVAAVRMTRCRE